MVEVVTSTDEETAFETQFATLSYWQCKTEVQTSYSTKMEIQCTSGYISKCKSAYKTGYRKFCTTVEDTECSTTVEATHKTVYEKQYSTVCHGAGYGKQWCSSTPKQQCQQVARHVQQTNTSRQCNPVPKERCQTSS